MGARTTCRVFKSDNMLLLYFKLIFTTTHHFHLFGGRIEKPDVNLHFRFCLHAFLKVLHLLTHNRYHSPGQNGRSTSPKPAVFCTSTQTTAFTNALEVLRLLWLRWVRIVLKRFIQPWFNVYRVISTIFFLLTLKFCPCLVHNLPEVGFTACSFLDPTGDFCEIVVLCVTNGPKPSSLLWLWKTKVLNLFW